MTFPFAVPIPVAFLNDHVQKIDREEKQNTFNGELEMAMVGPT